MAVAVDKEELRTGERGVGRWFWTRSSEKESLRVGHGTPLKSGAFSLQQFAEPHTTSGPWDMELWTAITIQKLGVEWGLIQTLAV